MGSIYEGTDWRDGKRCEMRTFPLDPSDLREWCRSHGMLKSNCDFCRRREEGMKDFITIANVNTTQSTVTLTRAQVEKALKDLNTPDPPKFKGGEIVRYGEGTYGSQYLVAASHLADRLRVSDGQSKEAVIIIAIRTGCWYWCEDPDQLTVLKARELTS